MSAEDTIAVDLLAALGGVMDRAVWHLRYSVALGPEGLTIRDRTSGRVYALRFEVLRPEHPETQLHRRFDTLEG